MKYLKHLKTILKHKLYVLKACIDCGIPYRGLKHDLSKLSPIEFFSSAKYFVGSSSPIAKEKSAIGYSKAWQHHKGRNTHHWQYWLDEECGSIYAIKLPIKDLIELVCDWIGAEKAYLPVWNEQEPLNYYNKQKDLMILHPETRALLEDIFISIATDGWKETSKELRKLKEYPKNK